MAVRHTGNIQPQLDFEEHDGVNNAKRVSIVSGAVGNATVNIGSSATISANIGLANSAKGGAGGALAGVGIMAFDGANWQSPSIYIPGDTDSNDLALEVMSRNQVWNGSSWTRARGDTNGLYTRNAGTTKTLQILPIGLGNNSLLTVAVPTNANKIKATQLILNSNITTAIAIKSGVTYLTGNASIGITLFPGGGFVMNGTPDSPVWNSLPSGAMVIEKRDSGGTVAQIGGHTMYFDEA